MKRPKPKHPNQKKINSNKDQKEKSNSLYDSIEAFLSGSEKSCFLILLFLSLIFSLLLFDAKISIGADDSAYIERAWNFIQNGEFPFFQGPGYPLFLSPFVLAFGINVILLKFTSVFCHLGFLFFTFLTFRKRIPYIVLFSLLSFCGFNNFFLYYSSQTYTEAYFLFVQSLALYFFFRADDTYNNADPLIKGYRKNIGRWLAVGLVFNILILSKSIAIICPVILVAFYLIRKEYKALAYVFISLTLFRMIYEIFIFINFDSSHSGQMELVLSKYPYNPTAGREDFAGFVQRYIDNFQTYISLHMYRILNFKSFNTDTINPSLSFLSAIIIIATVIYSYRKNKYIFFSGLYFIILCSGVFFGIHVMNRQDRLVLIAMPFIFLVFAYCFYQLMIRNAATRIFCVLFLLVLMFVYIANAIKKIPQGLTHIRHNLKGDLYYGFTPDWVNFLKLSRYCADSLPANSFVASRKASMSFIYGNGKKFYPVYSVFSTDADTILKTFKENGVTHVIAARLRGNQLEKADQYFVNTMEILLSSVEEKYPGRFQFIKREGYSESASVFEIKY